MSSECETEVVPVTYFVDVEFDDQSGVVPFGPVSSKGSADALLLTLAARVDVKKATPRKVVG